MNFSLKQLQSFLAVVQHGSTLAAATELSISQPAVSSALAGLEDNLGTPLFYRWRKRMVLNERGRALLPMARRLVDNARELDQMFSAADPKKGSILRLGASRTMASYVISEVLADFASSQPGVRIEVVSRNTAGVISQIEDFSLDIGVIAGVANKPDIINFPWITDSLCLFCSKDHPLAQKKVIDPEDLLAAQWIVREQGSGTLELLYGAIPDQMKPLQVAMTLDNIESIKRTVEKTAFLGCVSRYALKNEVAQGRLKTLETPFLNLDRNYSIIVHREKQNSVLFSYFIQFCLEAFRASTDSLNGAKGK
ncbi:MAG: LysR family transcriptional regulator [Desulfobulbaceae bacterium]|nr:MAG: LysR family transcriptional regulator [Desulfobulbaceae bacterium]